MLKEFNGQYVMNAISFFDTHRFLKQKNLSWNWRVYVKNFHEKEDTGIIL